MADEEGVKIYSYKIIYELLADVEKWQKELEELSSSHPNFRFVLTLSQPMASWTGKAGHVQDYIFSQQNLSDADYYLCGNKTMIDDMRAKLKAADVPDTQVKFELFY